LPIHARGPHQPSTYFPVHFETRYVSANGGIRWNCAWVNVSIACAGDYIGLEA